MWQNWLCELSKWQWTSWALLFLPHNYPIRWNLTILICVRLKGDMSIKVGVGNIWVFVNMAGVLSQPLRFSADEWYVVTKLINWTKSRAICSVCIVQVRWPLGFMSNLNLATLSKVSLNVAEMWRLSWCRPGNTLHLWYILSALIWLLPHLDVTNPNTGLISSYNRYHELRDSGKSTDRSTNLLPTNKVGIVTCPGYVCLFIPIFIYYFTFYYISISPFAYCIHIERTKSNQANQRLQPMFVW